MAKNVFKEIIIVLLLILAIILVLGVILYKYVPANKLLPEEISYVTPQSVKEQLITIKDANEDDVILTYELNGADLYNYQRINEYKPGKSNPFSTLNQENVENSSESGSNTTTNGSSSTTQNSSSSNTTSGTSSTTSNSTNSSTSAGGVNPGTYTNKGGLK